MNFFATKKPSIVKSKEAAVVPSRLPIKNRYLDGSQIGAIIAASGDENEFVVSWVIKEGHKVKLNSIGSCIESIYSVNNGETNIEDMIGINKGTPVLCFQDQGHTIIIYSGEAGDKGINISQVVSLNTSNKLYGAEISFGISFNSKVPEFSVEQLLKPKFCSDHCLVSTLDIPSIPKEDNQVIYAEADSSGYLNTKVSNTVITYDSNITPSSNSLPLKPDDVDVDSIFKLDIDNQSNGLLYNETTEYTYLQTAL
ncbi:MAG TPA: hypothetical protein DEP72_05100 [Clostridiales bacterium]|nr:MAG: hypothetical protein A2Y18_02250 [Clostridiales bacterium GWD2_32_19]HCC07518.1 hypothetical protein [Clostridiales bacterium]